MEKIAILGGGPAGLATAFELTAQKGWQERYEITVYQLGWRLGGKCASGCNPDAGDRIEEHGLHVLYGFYDNVFRMLRECYEELGRPTGAPLSTWREAVQPLHRVYVPERKKGVWHFDHIDYPPNKLIPGDPEDFTLGMLLRRILSWGAEGIRVLMANLSAALPKHLQRSGIGLDLMLAMARGLVADRLLGPPVDFGRVDDEDFRDWLRRHGAKEETWRSSLVEGLYAAAFATRDPRIGAGTMVHATLRMLLTYRGAFQYWLTAGMGEALIAPFYLVLRRRGVRFRFFHRVRRIELSADRSQVARVHIDRQATPRREEYEPLIDIAGLSSWPIAPLWDQLVEGDALRSSGENLEDWWSGWPAVEQKTLNHGSDFDRVVLAISVAAFPYICAELCADPGNPRFGQMVTQLKTTSTQSLQLWLHPDRARLGWECPERPILIPFAEPFDTWADMSHLLDRERWPPGQRPGSLHYFCAALADEEPLPPLEDRGYHQRQLARVRREARRWLRNGAPLLWPGAASRHDDDLNFYLLADRRDGAAEARLDAQYLSTPANPSDRYVLSSPGSSRYRLRPHESGYTNLILAGDWTKTSLNIGCLEAAFMSGHAAARAIWPSARPALADWLPVPSAERAPLSAPPANLPRNPSPPLRKGPAPRELPLLRRFDGSLVVPAPVGLAVRVYMFLLAAEPARLQKLCDHFLNLDGSTTKYQPLGPFVILYCASIDNFPLVERIGWCPELDFGFWVPMQATGPADPARGRVVTFTPYLWVDNAPALLGGREVFGFAKQLGRLTMPGWDAAPSYFAVDTLVLPRHAPDTVPVEKRVLEIAQRVTSATPAAGHGIGAAAHLAALRQSVRSLRDEGRGLAGPLMRFFLNTSRRGMRMVFLKQLPDASDGARACYQAILEGDLPILGIPRAEPIAGEFEVTLHRFDSLRIAENLGLRGVAQKDGAFVCRPLLQGRAAFDSRAERGVVVYQST